MKIGLRLPSKLMEQFSSLGDFDCVSIQDAISYDLRVYKHKELWLDATYGKDFLTIVEAIHNLQATHVIGIPVPEQPMATISNIEKLKDYCTRGDINVKIVGSWQGYVKDLRMLKAICAEVVLPWDRPRARNVTKTSCGQYYYLGYRNLDELRRLKPKGIITGMPYIAACMGIDLKIRSRRLKAIHDELPISGWPWQKAYTRLLESNVEAIRDCG